MSYALETAAFTPRGVEVVHHKPNGLKICDRTLPLYLNSLLQVSEYPLECSPRRQQASKLLSSLKPQLCWKSSPMMSRARDLPPNSFGPRAIWKRRNCSLLTVRSEGSHSDCCGSEPKGEFSYRRSSAPGEKHCLETYDQSGYVIKVSKELMGVFQYVEKVKRARLRELSKTLKQVAGACLVFSCVKGIVTPLVEVFKTDPPSWGKMIMFLGAFDAFAITYLAMRAVEPLEQLSALATEFEDENDMMGSIEKEEEHMLQLAVELVRLFRRLRNLALCTAVAQFAHIVHALLRLQESQPNFAIYISKFVSSWLHTPWT